MEFVFIFIITGALLVGASEDSNAISTIFEGFGYSPVCVASALASCELSSQKGFNKSVTSAIPSFQPSSQMDFYKHINESLGLLITLLQEIDQRNELPRHKDDIREKEDGANQADSCKIKESLAQIAASLNEIKPKKTRPLNCYEIRESGDTASGVRTIYPLYHSENKSVEVYCDQSTDGGGWTVFQRRDALPIREDFYRNWTDYVQGFGNLKGEFWLGLDNLHALTSSTPMEMRVDLHDYEGTKRWTKYRKFSVGDSSSKYKLDIGAYTGDIGDDMYTHNGMKFSTRDQDNDLNADHCAEKFKGAWWYNSCYLCNLNGFQHVGEHSSVADGINCKQFRGHNYSLKLTSMKVRPTN